ncbi:MAG: type I-F CRISPR-associated protein Csy2 [Pseudomonadota bacterium]
MALANLVNPTLLLSKIRIHNANALSSPFTIGFPAMTAWLGAVHALQRKLNQVPQLKHLRLNRTAIVSHTFDLQTHKAYGDFVHSIIGTTNPLDKDGSRPAFIEEARCHLTVSLVIEYSGIGPAVAEDFLLAHTEHILNSQLKMASGDILAVGSLSLEANEATLKRKLMPGYVLLERRDLMQQAMDNGQDAIDALLDYLVIHHQCQQVDDKVQWHSARKTLNNAGDKGWIIPIATGFHGISACGYAKNQRHPDPDIPHRFAESVLTLGQFTLIYKTAINNIFWHYHYYPEKALYLCEQDHGDTAEQETIFDF